VTDIIRQARAIYGPDFDRMMVEAGRIKQEYVAAGGRPEDVYSPERIDALHKDGPGALMGASQRGDGSIAGPYVPTEMALAAGLIEPRAVPAVTEAMNKGVNTVSSGFDPDMQVGFAIGRAPNGQVVRVER